MHVGNADCDIQDEYTVFIAPTSLQLNIFATLLNPDVVDDVLARQTTVESLALIGLLTKVVVIGVCKTMLTSFLLGQ